VKILLKEGLTMNNKIKSYLLVLIFLSPTAFAVPISFSFVDDPSDFPWISRSHTPGIVSGILFGLSDNGIGQTPTGIQFTSDVSPFGMTSNIVNAFFSFSGPGFDLLNGTVTGANMLLNFIDPTVGNMQIRFGYTDSLSPNGANVLHWNGGSGPVVGMGNVDNGFAGATYSSSVPVPGTIALFSLGLVGFSLFRGKKA